MPGQHRATTDRNLLLGFFGLLVLVGGGLVWVFYGGWAAAAGVVCFIAGAGLLGLLLVLLAGLQWLSDRLDSGE